MMLSGKKIVYAFPVITGKSVNSTNCSDDEFKSICNLIKKNNLAEDLEDFILKLIQDDLLYSAVDQIWSFFDQDTNCTTSTGEGFMKFILAIEYLKETNSVNLLKLNLIKKLRDANGYKRCLYGSENIFLSYKVLLKSCLHSKLPRDYETITHLFYKHSFDLFLNIDDKKSDSCCDVCHQPTQCCCNEMFSRVNDFLHYWDLFEQLAGNVITNLIQKHIEKHVVETCTGNFDRSYKKPLEQWLGHVVDEWLSKVYKPHSHSEQDQLDDFYLSNQKLTIQIDSQMRAESDIKMETGDVKLAIEIESQRKSELDIKMETNDAKLAIPIDSQKKSEPDMKMETGEVKLSTQTNSQNLKPDSTKMETVDMKIERNEDGGEESKSVDGKLAIYFEETKRRLLYLLVESYTRLRIDQLFNIIIEYPDSGPAIDDLRKCLKRINLRSTLTSKLQSSLETRLLHPGVNTSDILTAYISAIRSLKQVDPSGVLLETVTKPIRQYLRNRDDTIRCVVHSLTDEGPSDLAEELVSGSANVQNNEDEDDIADWENWMPDPVDADPSSNSKNRRTSDIITMLVNVYGSKELFVNEYRTLLADRLLSNFTYQTEKEIRYLELLKLRFGDTLLHCCEVMLKDIYDSKRINAHLHTDATFQMNNQDFSLTAMILSAQFWPTFKDETLELPEVFKNNFDVYTKAFESFKGNRTLNWKPHLGNVNLEIELKNGRQLNLTVSPTHAAIIYHFEQQSEWTIDQLSQVLHISATVLRRKITYWQSQGLIREISSDKFCLVEDTSSPSKTRSNTVSDVVCEDEETESAMASAHDLRQEELQVFWSYIVAMLTNLDGLPLERIHQMLKMFASQTPPSSIQCSIQELGKFLDRKVHEHKLLFSGSFYRLPKQ